MTDEETNSAWCDRCGVSHTGKCWDDMTPAEQAAYLKRNERKL